MSWTDRVVQYPNRIKLTAVSGQSGVYDMEYVEGEIEETGTLLNAENLERETNDLIDTKLSGAIYPSNMKAGRHTFTGSLTANSTYSKAITFDEPFLTPPVVVVSVESTVPHKRFVSWGNVTTTGFTMYINVTTNTSNMVVSWIALGV